MRNLLRIRNVRIYLLGDVISTLGDNALWLAMAIWMKELTGSSGWAGLVIFCFALGNLFSPLGGVLADRLPRRALLIGANLVSAALVLLILLVHGRGTMWLVFLVMFGYGVIGSAMSAAEIALLPSFVPADLLPEANGLQATMNEGLRLVTPLIGAGLFAWVGGGAVAVLDAGTFVIAAGTLAALQMPAVEPGAAPAGPAHLAAMSLAAAADGAVPGAAPALAAAAVPPADKDAAAGFRFLVREPVLRSITITLGFVLLALGFTESAGFSVVTAGLHRSATFVSVLLTAQGIGAVAGGLVAAKLLKRTSESLLVVFALCCVAAAVLLLTVPNLVADLAGVITAGIVGPWMLVAATTALQLRTPPALLGRVTGVFEVSLGLPQIGSIGLGAALIAVVNYRILLVIVAAAAILGAAYLLSVPETRRRGHAPDTTAAAVADLP